MLVACRAEYGRCEMRAWLLVVAASLLLVVVVVARQRDPLRRARLLKRAGLGVMAVVTALFGLVVAAEMFTDPGGWTALGLVAAWAVLLVILAAMAWYRPEGATRLFAVLIAAVIGVSVWFAANPEDWRGFEDRHGPIRAILSLVLAAAVALLGVNGRRRPGCCCWSWAWFRWWCRAWAARLAWRRWPWSALRQSSLGFCTCPRRP